MKLLGLKFKDIYFGISFSFFALMFVLFTFTSKDNALMTALLCCALHELGHLTAMLAFKQKPRSIIAYAGGIKITPSCAPSADMRCDLIVLLSGCGLNFLLAAVEYLRAGLESFAEINLLLAAFNLLPFRYFDGGRALEMLVSGKTLARVRAVFIGLLLMLVTFMFINSRLNLSLAVTAVCICVYEIIGSKAVSRGSEASHKGGV